MQNQIITCFITDLDGTLVDTKHANYLAYQRAFSDHGYELKKPHYERNFGLKFEELIKNIDPTITRVVQNKISTAKADHYRAVSKHLVLNQDLANFLTMMKPHHKLGLVTTAKARNAHYVLDFFGLTDLFDVCVFGDQVDHGKPDPECYNRCIKQLGARASECIIFEDSEVGIAAAQAAGAQVVKVVI